MLAAGTFVHVSLVQVLMLELVEAVGQGVKCGSACVLGSFQVCCTGVDTTTHVDIESHHTRLKCDRPSPLSNQHPAAASSANARDSSGSLQLIVKAKMCDDFPTLMPDAPCVKPSLQRQRVSHSLHNDITRAS